MESVQKYNSNGLGPSRQKCNSAKVEEVSLLGCHSPSPTIVLPPANLPTCELINTNTNENENIQIQLQRSLFSAATVRRQPSSCNQLAFHIKYETNTNTRIQKYEIQTQRSHLSPAKVSRQPSSCHEFLVSFAFHIKYKYRYKYK